MPALRVAPLLVLLSFGRANGADQAILGQRAIVTDAHPGRSSSRCKLVLQGEETGSSNTIVGDPTLEGATLIAGFPNSSEGVQLFPLPAARWTPMKSGFKYKDTPGAAGPVRAARIVQTVAGIFQIKAVAIGPSVRPPGAPTNGIFVAIPRVDIPHDEPPLAVLCARLTIGHGDRYHVRFDPGSSLVKHSAKIFSVADAPGEGLCGRPVIRSILGKRLWNVDLAGADLTYVDLTGADLWQADLTGATLTGATLTTANLEKTDLSSAILAGANLSDASLVEANLTGSTLTAADLFRASLLRADLTDADLTGATLAGARLEGANLTRADLSGVHLDGLDLSTATLTGIHGQGLAGCPAALPPEWGCRGAFLVGPGANLAGADLSNLLLYGATLTGADLTGAHLSGNDLRGVHLSGADLTGADLRRANLAGADLLHTNLTGADLARANLTGARLDGTVLVGADLADADVDSALLDSTDLSGADLRGVDLSTTTLTFVHALNLAGCPATVPPDWACRASALVGPHANLSDANLATADLSNVNLTRADFSRADLTQAILAGANLTQARLLGANLSAVDLRTTTLTGIGASQLLACPLALPGDWVCRAATLLGPSASLVQTHLEGKDLGGLNLAGVDLFHADLAGASLAGASLTGASLGGAVLTGADLTAADLTGTDLRAARLTDATLTDARIGSVLWLFTVCPDGTRSDTNGSNPESCCANLNRSVPAVCSP